MAVRMYYPPGLHTHKPYNNLHIDQAKTNYVHTFQVLTLVTNTILAETRIVSSRSTVILSRARPDLVA